MAFSIVQQKVGAWASGSTVSITLDNPPAAGNRLVLLYTSTSALSAHQIASISGGGGTWTATTTTHVARDAEIWTSTAVSGTLSAVVIQLGGTGASSDTATLIEVAGTVDTILTGTGQSATNTTPLTPDLTPPVGHEVILFAVTREGAAPVSGPTDSFNALTSSDGGSRVFSAYRVITTPSGAYHTSWTSASGQWEAAIGGLSAPATLTFSTQPSNVTSGVANSPSIVVTSSDTTFTGTVTLTKASGTGSVTSGSSVSAVAGVATFPAFIVSGSGAWTLSAAATGHTSVTSASFTVTAAASTLTFSTQPSNCTSGVAISPSIVVTSSDSSFTGVVTLTKASGTGSVTSGDTATAVAGVATFPSMIVTGSGAWTLQATATGQTADTSSSFTVTAAGTPDALAWANLIQCTQTGKVITPAFTVQLMSGGVAAAQAGVTVTLTRTSGTSTLSGTTTATTDAAGVATFSNVILTGAGRNTLTATTSGVGPFTAAEYVTIRPAAHSFNAALNNNSSPSTPQNPATTTDWYYLDPVHNRRVYYRFWAPSTALAPSTGTPTPILFYTGGVGSEDDGGKTLSTYCVDCETALGVQSAAFATAGLACFTLYVQRPAANSLGAYRGSTRRACVNALFQLIDDGWNIDLTRMYGGGYSTGGIEMQRVAYEYPNLLAGWFQVDGGVISYVWYNGIGSVFNGPRDTVAPTSAQADWSIPTAAFFDPTCAEDGSQGGPNFYGEVARVWAAGGAKQIHIRGTDNTEYLPQRITQNDGTANTDWSPIRYRAVADVGYLFDDMQALGKTFLESKATGTFGSSTSGTLACPALSTAVDVHRVLYHNGNNNWPDGRAYYPMSALPANSTVYPPTGLTATGYNHSFMFTQTSYTKSPEIWNRLLAAVRSSAGTLLPIGTTGTLVKPGVGVIGGGYY